MNKKWLLFYLFEGFALISIGLYVKGVNNLTIGFIDLETLLKYPLLLILMVSIVGGFLIVFFLYQRYRKHYWANIEKEIDMDNLERFNIPIDSSNAKSIIPPGEEILYSTLCKSKSSRAPYYKVNKMKAEVLHVLITPRGAYTKNINNYFTEPHFETWKYIIRLTKKGYATIIGLWSNHIRLLRLPKEKKREFNKRLFVFKKIIEPLYKKGKEISRKEKQAQRQAYLARKRAKKAGH